MIFTACERRAWTFGLLPEGLAHNAPPRSRGHGVGNQLFEAVFGQMHPENEGPSEALSLGDVSGSLYKGRKLGVGHRCGVDGERRKIDCAYWTLAISGKAKAVIGTHEKAPAGKRDHVVLWRL
jgi:hypothetical protein